jgi:PAS domain S-box-containing protein
MKDQSKTRQALIQELSLLRQKIAELEQSGSDRKNVMEALRKSGERYRTVARLSSEFAYSCIHTGDDGYEVDWITDAFFTLTNYSEAELHEQRCWLFVSHPDDREMATKPLRELKAGESDTREFRIVTKGGRVLYIINHMECQGDPKAPGGLRLFGAVQDITERKQAEEALRLSEENFRRSLGDSPLGVRIVTIEGETIYANRAILDINGCDSLDELKIIPVEKRYTPESFAEHQIRKEKRKRGDDVPSEYDISIVKKDDEVRHLQVFRKEILWDGERQFQVLYNDITERKRMEEEKHHLAERSRKAVEDIFRFIPEGVLVFSRKMELLRQNQTFRDLVTGYARRSGFAEDELENLIIDKVKAGLRDNNIKEIKIARKHEHSEKTFDEFEELVLELDMARIIFAEEEEEEARIVVSIKDITERKLAEAALRESEQRFKNLYQDSPIPTFTWQKKGDNFILVDFNSAAIQITNGKVRDHLGNSAVELYKNRPHVLSDMNLCFQERSVVRREITSQNFAPGRFLSVHYGFISQDLIIVHTEDQTDRKQAEEALRKSQERLIEAHSLAHIGVWNWVAETDTVLWTEELYRIAGLDPLLPAPTYAEHSNIYAPESWGLLKEAVERAIKTGETYQLELKLIRPDGTTRWVNAFGGPTNDNHGRIEGLQGTVQDITDRKQAEEELKTYHSQLRALAKRLQQIREEERVVISREVHDEMGGGLTGLKMDLSWLLHKMSDADPGEERVALMDKIQTANALIDEMIQVVRRISTDLRPSILDDLGLIAALEWQLSEFTSRTEIPHEFATTLEYVDMEDDTAVSVFRIFQETLTNVARHARATKVVVVLREGERSLFGYETLVLEIRDNGKGITEEEILNPESLGLLGMKERVLTFGGNLSIRGKPGGGTTLVLKIPRKRGESS